MAQPLDGLLVVTLEQAVAAPFCTSRLADAGARVIKIERHEGDFARGYDNVVNGESSYFVWLNRGKESICLDIKNADDRALILRLLGRADVFVQNLAPGAAERAGFGTPALQAANPRLIVVEITGYGATGPYRDKKAYDLLVQCESGLASVTGSPAEPGRVGISVSDIACGMSAHAAVLEALLEREKTGKGKHLQVSLFDAVADWMTVPLLHQEYAGSPPPRVGISHASIAPYGAYDTSDGKQVVIAIQNSREWKTLCEKVLEKASMVDDPMYATNIARCNNRKAMDEQINSVFSNLSRQQIIAKLDSSEIAYGAVNDLETLSKHPQLRRCATATHSGGVDLVAPPALEPGIQPILGAVPQLGQHTDSIRAEFSTEKQSRE